MRVLGIPEVCARWEINDPLQVIDILAMMGDAVDNIRNYGVGEKTAIKLPSSLVARTYWKTQIK